MDVTCDKAVVYPHNGSECLCFRIERSTFGGQLTRSRRLGCRTVIAHRVVFRLSDELKK